MANESKCLKCGAPLTPDARDGVCPKCLLGLALGSEPGEESSDAAPSPPVITERPGTIIGRYKLLQRLGEGGMGSVLVAEQTEPVRRTVALKLIKLGMDTKEVIARFEAERQALALMDHPNIARVLDAGATPTGRPYFVMELVKGIRLTSFCDEQRLSVRERLELFMQVCQAVQHAHQKGVIHRDLKPSNVLVALYDGRPVPKVIDFGVAKATGQRLTERTLYTQLGAVVGTLEYMSPEQAELNQLDIDTRSDIYSLGVLLYELLTGTTPLTRETVRQAAFDEVLKRIRNEEPPKPSLRLSTSGEKLPTISAQRKLEPEKLTKAMQGELDWIVMKALEKERSRRYETASGLALDIQHYLNDEPVLAGPPTVRYRAKKFVRKHRRAVAVAAAFMVLLVAAVVVSTGLALMLKQESDQKEQALRRTEEKAIAESKAKEQAKQQSQRAEQALAHLALQRAEDFFTADDAPQALAELARLLRDQPTNSIVAQRLLSALTWRDFPSCLLAFRRETEGGGLLSASFSRDGQKLLVVKNDTLSIWDVTTCQPAYPLLKPITNVSEAALSPDGRTLATQGYEAERNVVRIWGLPTGRPLTPGLPWSGESGWPQSLEFSPDSQRLLCADKNFVLLRDAATGAELVAIKATNENGFAFSRFSPDGERLITCENYPKHTGSGQPPTFAQMWETRTGKAVSDPFPHDPRKSLVFSPDGKRVLGVVLAGAQCFDLGTGQAVGPRWPQDRGSLGSTEFSHDGRLVLTTHGGGQAAFYDITNGERRGPSFHDHNLGCATVSPDGATVATGSGDGMLRFWNVQSGLERMSLKAHPDLICLAMFSPDGQRLLTVDREGTGRLWDVATGKRLSDAIKNLAHNQISWTSNSQRLICCNPLDRVMVLDLRPGNAWPAVIPSGVRNQRIRFGPDRTRFVAWGTGAAQVWDAQTLRPITPLLVHTGQLMSACFSSDGRRLLTATLDSIQAWDAQSGQPLHPPTPQPQSWVHGPEAGWLGERDGTRMFSPDGTRVLAIHEQGVELREVDGGKKLAELSQPGDTVKNAQFSPDGQHLVAVTARGIAHLWDVRQGRRLSDLGAAGTQFSAGRYSPDGRRLALVGDTQAQVCDARDGRPVAPLAPYASRRLSRYSTSQYWIEFSADGRRLLIRIDGWVQLWNVEDGSLVAERLKDEGTITHARFTADSRRLLTLSDRRCVRLWNAATGQPVSGPIRHVGWSVDVMETDDGRWLATLESRNTARVWETSSGQPVSEPLRVSGRWIQALRFSPRGQHLLTSGDENVRAWEMPFQLTRPPAWLAELAEAVAGQRLSEQRVLEAVPATRFIALREELLARADGGAWGGWAKWFLANRETRTISPLAHQTVPEYVQERSQEEKLGSLREVIRLSPTNGLAYARLARQVLAQTDQENPRRVREADSLSRNALEWSPSDAEAQRVRAEVVEQIRESLRP